MPGKFMVKGVGRLTSGRTIFVNNDIVRKIGWSPPVGGKCRSNEWFPAAICYSLLYSKKVQLSRQVLTEKFLPQKSVCLVIPRPPFDSSPARISAPSSGARVVSTSGANAVRVTEIPFLVRASAISRPMSCPNENQDFSPRSRTAKKTVFVQALWSRRRWGRRCFPLCHG